MYCHDKMWSLQDQAMLKKREIITTSHQNKNKNKEHKLQTQFKYWEGRYIQEKCIKK